MKAVEDHLTWQQIDSLSGTAQKTIDFSKYDEVYNGGYTAGTGAQCEWEISKTSCRLLACYVGGTNYTGSATTIYAR